MTPQAKDLHGFFIWLKQMQSLLPKFVLVLLACVCGCDCDRGTTKLASIDNSVSNETDTSQYDAPPTEEAPDSPVPSVSASSVWSDPSAAVEEAAPKIKPGFYPFLSGFRFNSDGDIIVEEGAAGGVDEYAHFSNVLAASDASIHLDGLSGIQWYDRKLQTRSKLEDINDARPLLASIERKHLVTISLGKAGWEKESEYIAKIAGFADELGFGMTVVTMDNSQGLLISEVIQH